MQRRQDGRLELRFLGPGPRGRVESEDGSIADFDGWTDLGRAIHDLAAAELELDDGQPAPDEGDTL
jgi:hypothetical protein